MYFNEYVGNFSEIVQAYVFGHNPGIRDEYNSMADDALKFLGISDYAHSTLYNFYESNNYWYISKSKSTSVLEVTFLKNPKKYIKSYIERLKNIDSQIPKFEGKGPTIKCKKVVLSKKVIKEEVVDILTEDL